MQKSKLGISVNLLAALVYMIILISNSPLAAAVVVGYILLVETDPWLRRAAVKAIVVFLGIALLIEIIRLLPNALSWLNQLLDVFDQNISYGKLTLIISVITHGLTIIRTILMIVLAMKAFKRQDIAVVKVDQVVDKNM